MGKTLKETISEEQARRIAEDIFNGEAGIIRIKGVSRPNRIYLSGLPQESLVTVTIELGLLIDEYHKSHKDEDLEIDLFTEDPGDAYPINAGYIAKNLKVF